MARASGTVTFLFSDIEGSTRRWESDPEAMQAALVDHDDIIRTAVEGHGGRLFKHTGDGICAAFDSARAATEAAVAAQRLLQLPVRMGIATGEAHERGGDYFGLALSRAARVMAVGHGGQILVAASTALLLDGVDLIDLGEHRLRDLSGGHRLFQVRADGLPEIFPPLRTLSAVPSNLPVIATSFVGRDAEAEEVARLVRSNRVVTLTGVGGVGKTRLALQVAAELIGEFPEGIWLIELAPVGEAGAVPDVVATTLGVTQQSEMSMAASVAQALSGRCLLLVLDNCEHVLDATAELVDTILTRARTVKVLATSREALRIPPEHAWTVPSLDVSNGRASAAAELFIARAEAADSTFALHGEADAAAVTEICSQLDGNPLAIELAAARMVAMNPAELLERLSDRFRLLSRGPRGSERHQTLRDAVAWSYDLLVDAERTMLKRCAVFAGGFDLAAAAHLNGGLDCYGVLDVLESLVRKSLIVAEQVSGHTRYSMLETIRQFGQGELAATDALDEVRDLHAQYFASQACARWELWDGPEQRAALDWVDAELGNLRAAFRWATDRNDLGTATAIAAHAAILGFGRQLLEPVGWAEEILPAAALADLVHLPRLLSAASLCAYTGRPEDGVRHGELGVRLEADSRYDPFPDGLGVYWEAAAHLYAGALERAFELVSALAARTGTARVYGRGGQTLMLGMLGRREEAAAIAEDALAMAVAHGNPFFVAQALHASGLAYEQKDPVRALAFYHRGLAYAHDQHLSLWEAILARVAARVEAVYGDADRALLLYDSAVESLHRAGDVVLLAVTLLSLASSFHRFGRPEVAAVLHGAATRATPQARGSLADRLRATLGDDVFERSVKIGAELGPGQAVRYAREEIDAARRERATEATTGRR
jgi:predicted ATPase